METEPHEIPESYRCNRYEAEDVESNCPARRLCRANAVDRQSNRCKLFEHSEKSGGRWKRDANCDESLKKECGGEWKGHSHRLESKPESERVQQPVCNSPCENSC